MKHSTLTLPRMKLQCMRCHHTWKQATPLWDRGHMLMKRRDRIVFVVDDLLYALNQPIQAAVAPLLRELGYSDFVHACPECGHSRAQVIRGLLSPPNYGTQELPSAFLLEEDFIKAGQIWQFRPETIEALAQ